MKKDEFNKFLEKELIMVLDTNVILNLARYSIFTSKLILNKFEDYIDCIWLPNQVINEYNKNKMKVFGQYEKKYSDVFDDLVEVNNKNKINLKSCVNKYRRNKYLYLQNLEDDILNKYDEIEKVINEFKNKDFSESENEDKSFTNDIKDFVNWVIDNRKFETRLTTQEFLLATKEGELRYKYNIPPGYLDKDKANSNKNNNDTTYKDLTSKFGDYFLWKEILKLPSVSKCESIIFITDDTKGDWGNFDSNNKFTINEFLLKEFSETNPETSINFLTTEEFFNIFYNDNSYKISYFELNVGRDKFISRVEDRLIAYVEEYIRDDNLYSLPNVKSDMIENIEVLSSGLDDYKISYIVPDDDSIEIGYDVFCYIELTFDSYLYSGRDDDTGEIIYDQGRYHNFTFYVKMEINRSLNYKDDNFKDKDYDINDIENIDFIENSCDDYGYDDFYY